MNKEELLWTDSLSVNDSVIDAHHRHLIDLINELAGEEADNNPYVFVRLLTSLTNYCRVHFSDEETFMERFGYPDTQMHKAEHLKFIYKISMFNIEYTSSVPTGAVEVFQYLKSWMVNHIMKSDMGYRDFIVEKLGQKCG